MAGTYGMGTTLTVNGLAVANLTSIDGPELTLETVDVTAHDSEGGYREFVPTIRDGGDVNLAGNFTDVEAAEVLLDLLNSADLCDVVITFPTDPEVTWTFEAIVTQYKTNSPHDSKIDFSARLKVSGEPVLAEAS